MSAGSLKARYAKLTSIREPYLQRARECAALTIPSLMPPSGHSSGFRPPTPYQALGARGINNLAAKLLLTILPPNQAFFRLVVDDYLLEQMAGREGMRADVEEALDRMERSVMSEIEGAGSRPSAFEALKQLLAAGNVLVFAPPEGGLKVFRMDRYVAKRDPMGNVLEIISKEDISLMELPEEVRAVVLSEDRQDGEGKLNAEDSEELYTCVKRSASGWDVWQEVCGKEVPGSRGRYPADKCPWMALRFIKIDGEDYGRSYVEEYLGDLKTLEGLTKAIVQAAAASSKVVFLVKPNATTSVKDLAGAESGDFKAGNGDDISTVQTEKYHDLRVAYDTIQRITEALSYAFLLNSAIQRNGERVTAEEIRYMANELETALGGVYANLSQEFQLPYVTVVMAQLQRKGRIPALPRGMVRPTITTGIDALGRGNDLTKLSGLLQDISVLGPEVISQHLNVADFIKRCAAARGIDQKGLVLTPEQQQANAQQEQAMQMLNQLGPNAVTQVGQMARDQMSQQPPK